MIHEHEFELASAAIDFELTPAEQARLDKAIAECSECARAATSYRRQATLFEALPVVDASPAVRRHVERAAGLRPQQRTPWTWALLAAAMLGLLVTSVLVAGAIDQNRRNDLVDVVPTPEPSAMPTPSAPPNQPSPDVIALDPPSGGLADVGPPLARDSLAIVVTDNLRVRSAPFVGDLSVRYRRFLQPDDRLFVVDGPVIAQNYEWYQVKAWRPRQPSISWPVGWVARAGHDGEVWLRASTRACPAQPVDVTALLALAPIERVACFHDGQIEIQAVIAQAATGDCDTAREGCPGGPAWLASPSLVAAASTASLRPGDGVQIAIGPDGSVAAGDLATAGVARLRGAFDHPDSSGCQPDPERVGPDGPLSPSEAVLRCRGRFVVTSAVVEPFGRRSNVPAITVSDRLRVRSLPEVSDASIRYEPLLRLGSRLWVADGPTLADGYAWYQVIAPIPGSGGTVSRWLTGWVAAAGKNGEQWIEDATIDCPAASDTLTLADLARIRQRPIDDGPLACFAASEIQLEGRARLHCEGNTSFDAVDTAWLSNRLGRWLEIVDGVRTLEARIDPAGPPIDLQCGELSAGRVRINGHFADPAADRCTVPLPGSTDARVPAHLCRTYFVAKSLELGAPSVSPSNPRGG